MKKAIFVFSALVAFTLVSCHYGQNEAQKTLERNDEYKTEKQDYSVNRAGEGGKMNADTKPVENATPADTTSHSK